MDYIAAGFDPDGFFHLTPRAYQTRMDAARKRDRTRAVLAAQAVWHGTHLEGGALKDWCANILGETTAMPESALVSMLAKNSAGLKTVSWAEAFKDGSNGPAERA